MGVVCALSQGYVCRADVPADLGPEIVVTARKIIEPLADVPLAIQVISREDLRQLGVDGLQALSAQVPGFYFESSFGGSPSSPTLRGQTQPNQGGSNVGIFVDGVYQANNAAVDASMLDVDRMEVVKGPQSSLYGRSTFSGAINYVSRQPSEKFTGDFTADGGSDGYRGVSGVVSGPLGDSGVRARVALRLSEFGGTGINTAQPGDNLGGGRKASVSATLSYSPESWDISANLRYSDDLSEQPAVSEVTAADYNCGSHSARTGYWSYFCGNVPRVDRYDISPGIPDSASRTWQASLHVRRLAGEWTFDSLSSWYRSSSDLFRDFDESSAGERFGVCTLGVNCDPSVDTARISRFVSVNEVTHDFYSIEEVTEEMRARFHAGRFAAVLGALLGSNRSSSLSDVGAAPSSALADDERLTVILPETPQRVEPMSIFNRFLVTNPNTMLVNRFPTDIEHQHFTDLFASADLSVTARLDLHAELRAGLFNSSSATTPRVSVDYHPAPGSLIWLSVAEGQNNGGINPDPTLIPAEQRYGPESNITYEVGFRGPNAGGRVQLDAAAFYIDWRNTQILVPSNSPGDHNFITRNLSGVQTEGVELAADGRLPGYFTARIAYSYDRATFKQGSEDVGSIKVCGIEDGNTTSNFCTIGPSRYVLADAPLVPYVDGNFLLRAPEQQWVTSLTYAPPASASHPRWFLRADLSHQGSLYARPAAGASYGQRTLLNARLGISQGAWSADLWGSNLTNALYVREVDSRGPAFFPVSPRPLDLLYGDGRRFGLGVTWHF